MARTVYQADATRTHDGWWYLQVRGVARGFTQCRRLDQAEAQVRDLIATLLQLAPDSFDVEVQATPPAAAAQAAREPHQAGPRTR